MKKQIQQVSEFHAAFGVKISEAPCMLPSPDHVMRFQLMKEENEEYDRASNLPEVADALGDQLYVLFGTIIQHGLQDVIEEVFDRIHKNNMSKLGSDGKPIINGQNGVYDPLRPQGKILKPDGFEPVKLEDIFSEL